MGRYADVLGHLSIDGPARETIAPAVKGFLEAAKELQRHLLPLNGSVHAGVSRITTQQNDSATTLIQWISIYDRVGLFNVEDDHVSRHIDAALRYVWRKEEADAMIAATGGAADRLLVVRDALRALRASGGFVGDGGVGGAGTGSNDGGGGSREGSGLPGSSALPPLNVVGASTPTISPTRPPLCVAPPGVVAVVKTVVDLVAASENPAVQCREIVVRVFESFQQHVIGRTALTRGASAVGTACNGAAPAAEVAAAAALVGATLPGAAGPAGGAAGAAAGGEGAARAPCVGVDSTGVAVSLLRDGNGHSNNGQGDEQVARKGDDNDGQDSGDGHGDGGDGQGDGGDGQGDGGDGQGDGGDGQGDGGDGQGDGGDGQGDGGDGQSDGGDEQGAGGDGQGDGGDGRTGVGATGTGAGGAPTPNGQITNSAAPVGGGAPVSASGTDGGRSMKLSDLLDIFRSKWWPTWHSRSKGVKSVAPEGTVANPFGRHSELRFRSMWCQRVCMKSIKVHLKSPALDVRRLKVTDTPDVLILEDMTNLRFKKIPTLLGLLMLLCTHEEEALGTVRSVVAEGITARPSRHRSLVPSVVELERRVAGGAASTDAGSEDPGGSLGCRRVNHGEDGGGEDGSDATKAPSAATGTLPPGGARQVGSDGNGAHTSGGRRGRGGPRALGVGGGRGALSGGRGALAGGRGAGLGVPMTGGRGGQDAVGRGGGGGAIAGRLGAGRATAAGAGRGGGGRGAGQFDDAWGDTIRTGRTVATDAAFFFQVARTSTPAATASRAKRMQIRRLVREASNAASSTQGCRLSGPSASPPPKRRRTSS